MVYKQEPNGWICTRPGWVFASCGHAYQISSLVILYIDLKRVYKLRWAKTIVWNHQEERQMVLRSEEAFIEVPIGSDLPILPAFPSYIKEELFLPYWFTCRPSITEYTQNPEVSESNMESWMTIKRGGRRVLAGGSWTAASSVNVGHVLWFISLWWGHVSDSVSHIWENHPHQGPSIPTLTSQPSRTVTTFCNWSHDSLSELQRQRFTRLWLCRTSPTFESSLAIN